MTIANTEMANAWDGEEGDHWTEFADRYDAVGARYWTRFVDSGAVSPGDRVLDVGCGAGESTIDAASRAGSGFALGADLSTRMLGLARQRAAVAGVDNVEFVQADAQVHPFDADAFDLVISRFGAMFFADQVAAFRNIGAALRPGGRMALLAWQGLADNEWLVALRRALAAGRDLPVPPNGGVGPFGLADTDGVRERLGAAGFADVEFDVWREPLRFGDDPADAWSFVQHIGMVKGLTHGLDDEARADALRNVQAELDSHATPDGVLFGSAAFLITATRP